MVKDLQQELEKEKEKTRALGDENKKLKEDMEAIKTTLRSISDGIMPGEKRKRGRPKGSTNKTKVAHVCIDGVQVN